MLHPILHRRAVALIKRDTTRPQTLEPLSPRAPASVVPIIFGILAAIIFLLLAVEFVCGN